MPAASAQQIPPRAFQTRNVRQRIWSAPASQAAVTRAPATKRRARGDGNDHGNLKLAFVGQHASTHQRHLARQRQPHRLQPDESREREVPEVRRQLKEGN
jgi:hypothetical protein